MRAFTLLAALLLCLGTVQTTSAATIAGATQITPSTSVASCPPATCVRTSWDIAEIVDGITNTSALNGFAGDNGALGTITLDLLGIFNLDSFVLFNDIVLGAEGVETFSLTFFDSTDTLITTSSIFTTTQGTAGGETFIFGSTVNGVSKVDLDVLSLRNGSRIEIREVQFKGTEAAPVPLPAGLPLLAAALLTLALTRRRST